MMPPLHFDSVVGVLNIVLKYKYTMTFVFNTSQHSKNNTAFVVVLMCQHARRADQYGTWFCLSAPRNGGVLECGSSSHIVYQC